VLVATAHLGNWELSAFTHAIMTAPMHIVVRPLDNPRVNAWVENRRSLSGNHIIQKKDAAREILRALSAGSAVGILIDKTPPLRRRIHRFLREKRPAPDSFRQIRSPHGSGGGTRIRLVVRSGEKVHSSFRSRG